MKDTRGSSKREFLPLLNSGPHKQEKDRTENMKIAGIIAEYNPFHRGHEYHLKEARKACGADYVIAVMSGSFVQRGEPAIADKYTRARMALLSGADLVVELPFAFACSAAPDFALGGVKLLDALGADCLCFGSETGDLSLLEETASRLAGETPSQSVLVREGMKKGLSYADSLKLSLSESVPGADALFSGSNDILALEYCKAILKLSSGLRPVAVKRVGQEYNDLRQSSSAFMSASAVREMILNGGLELLNDQIPPAALAVLLEALSRYTPVTSDDFSDFAWYALSPGSPLNRTGRAASDRLAQAGADPDLAMRLANNAAGSFLISELTEAARAKNISRSSVRRAVFRLVCGLNAESMDVFRGNPEALYARILGFRRESAPLLSHLKQVSGLPLVAKTADAEKLLPPAARELFNLDIGAANLYAQAVYRKCGYRLPDEYRAGIVII